MLDGVPQGVYVGIRCLQESVDLDPALLPDLQVRLPGQGAVRTYPHAQDNQIDPQLLAAGQMHYQLAEPRFEGCDSLVQVKFHFFGFQMLMDFRRHLEVQGRHDLFSHLHDRNEDTPVVEVLRHLQTYEPGTDDQRPLHFVFFDVLFDPIGVRDIAYREDPLQVDSGYRRLDRFGPGREHQLVVALLVDFFCLRVCNGYVLPLAVDGRYLRAHTDIDLETGGEALRRLNKQVIPVGDHIADVVGKAAVGVGDILAPLEEDDLRLLVHPAQPGRGGRSPGNSADDHNFGHSFPPW